MIFWEWKLKRGRIHLRSKLSLAPFVKIRNSPKILNRPTLITHYYIYIKILVQPLKISITIIHHLPDVFIVHCTVFVLYSVQKSARLLFPTSSLHLEPPPLPPPTLSVPQLPIYLLRSLSLKPSDGQAIARLLRLLLSSGSKPGRNQTDTRNKLRRNYEEKRQKLWRNYEETRHKLGRN